MSKNFHVDFFLIFLNFYSPCWIFQKFTNPNGIEWYARTDVKKTVRPHNEEAEPNAGGVGVSTTELVTTTTSSYVQQMLDVCSPVRAAGGIRSSLLACEPGTFKDCEKIKWKNGYCFFFSFSVGVSTRELVATSSYAQQMLDVCSPVRAAGGIRSSLLACEPGTLKDCEKINVC